MTCLQLAFFVLQVALLHSVQSKALCDLSNTECTTSAGSNAFKTFIVGVPGVVDSSDPIRIDTVTDEYPGIKYELTNLKMTGLSNCHVTQVKVVAEKSIYQFGLLCPQLTLNHNYDINGILGPVETIGKGLAVVTLNDYAFDITGKYEKYTSEKDQKLHFRLKKYDVEFGNKGTVTLDLQGPFNPDEAKSKLAKDWIYANINEYEKMLRAPTLKKYVAKFLENYETYLKETPIDDIFSA